MAKEAPKGAAATPKPFPSNWASMTSQQKREWQARNRGPMPSGEPARPAQADDDEQRDEQRDKQRDENGDEQRDEKAPRTRQDTQPFALGNQADLGQIGQQTSNPDARKMIARILRAIAEGFDSRRES